jgi:hypothetical protein
MEIDRNEKQSKNAHCSIRFNLDPDSKVTDDSIEQSAKHSSQRTSTVEGIQIDSKSSQ